jgi:uncharacterized membrane protein YGL010W
VLRRICVNYLARHKNVWNRALHGVGVPGCFFAAPAAFACGSLRWALACFIGGYVLQFVGHAIEGNDAGEVIVVKRWLGLPVFPFGSQAFDELAPRKVSKRGD